MNPDKIFVNTLEDIAQMIVHRWNASV